MLNIGCHLSVSKGFKHMGKTALEINANTFQFFTRNPRGSKAKAIDPKDVKELLNIMEENSFAKLLAHAPYTLNPSSSKEEVREFALMTMKDDLLRMEYLPGNYYNFHPGTHVGQGVDVATEMIINTLNEIISENQSTIILLETMSGKGTEIGRNFEELQNIISGVKHPNLIGVCMDTCHIHEAGYDIVNNLDGVMEEFDKIIGLDKLYAIHLNDSKNEIGAQKDRHEKIGEGKLGIETFRNIVNHKALKDLPFYLETPNELPGYAQEIELLKSMVK